MPRRGSSEGYRAPGGGYWPPEAYPRGSNAPTSTAAVGTAQGAYPGIADSIFDAPGVNVAGAGPHQYSEPDALPSVPDAPLSSPRGQVSYDFGTDPIAFLIANGFMPPIAASSYDDAGTPRGPASDLANLGDQDIPGEPTVVVNGNTRDGLSASSDRVNVPTEDTGDEPKPQISGNEGFLKSFSPTKNYPIPGLGGLPSNYGGGQSWQENAARSTQPSVENSIAAGMGFGSGLASLGGNEWQQVSELPSGLGSISWRQALGGGRVFIE